MAPKAPRSRAAWMGAVIFLAAVILGTQQSGTSHLDSSRSQPPVDVGGASGPGADQPNRVTAGSYRSSVTGRHASPGAEERGSQAATIDESKQQFAGWMNGIYLYPTPLDAPGFVPDPAANARAACPGTARTVSEAELEITPYYIDVPSGLPPGAVEGEGIYAEACGDDVTLVSRQFQLQPYGALIGIVLRPQAKGASFPTSVDRVTAGAVNGMAAVLVTPVTEDGYGNSAIFVLTPVGLAQIGGLDVRFSDLLTVAESITWQ